MPRFKVGDRIRLTGREWEGYTHEGHTNHRGDIVTVDEVNEYTIWSYLAGGLWRSSADEPFNGFEVELVTEAPPSGYGNSSDPDHYKFPGGAEVREISRWLTANSAQALQYVARSSRIDGRNKGNAVEDLTKAIRFLEFEIDRLESL